MPATTPSVIKEIKEIVLRGPWNQVLDVVEFAAMNYTYNMNPVYAAQQNSQLIEGCNNIFE